MILVIDNSGYKPKQVRLSGETLKGHVQHYLFISSISVYADFKKPGMDEAAVNSLGVKPLQPLLDEVHAIKDRAIVENGQVIAAPMMYIALSYDHRIIDGKDAVLFLVDIKNQLENPSRMLLGM